MVTVLNTLTGKTASIRRWIFESPLYNGDGHLVEVKPGTKPYVGAYKPKTAKEFKEVHPDKIVVEKVDNEDKAEEADE